MLNSLILKQNQTLSPSCYCPLISSFLSSASWKSASTSCRNFPMLCSWLSPSWPSVSTAPLKLSWQISSNPEAALPFSFWLPATGFNLHTLSLHPPAVSSSLLLIVFWWLMTCSCLLFSLGCPWPPMGLTLHLSSVNLSQVFIIIAWSLYALP